MKTDTWARPIGTPGVELLFPSFTISRARQDMADFHRGLEKNAIVQGYVGVSKAKSVD
jgi:hypothetical protein